MKSWWLLMLDVIWNIVKSSYKIFLIGLFVLFVTTLIVVETYALFETNSNGAKTLDISDWVIYVNDTDITETRTITLNDFTYVNGSHTRANRFAPGSSAYFELEIDASDAQVSVAYDLEIDDSQIADYPNINFTITDTDTNTVINDTEYSGTILLSDQNRTKTLRINLVWTDNSLYDESDTSLIGETLAFTINAHFEQYTGE